MNNQLVFPKFVIAHKDSLHDPVRKTAKTMEQAWDKFTCQHFKDLKPNRNDYTVTLVNGELMSGIPQNEEWRDILGYEGYYRISSTGLICSVGRWTESTEGIARWWPAQMMKLRLSNHGAQVVSLTKDRVKSWPIIARIVLQTFVGDPPSVEHLALHWNGDVTDNNVDNLFWGTHQDLVVLRTMQAES